MTVQCAMAVSRKPPSPHCNKLEGLKPDFQPAGKHTDKTDRPRGNLHATEGSGQRLPARVVLPEPPCREDNRSPDGQGLRLKTKRWGGYPANLLAVS